MAKKKLASLKFGEAKEQLEKILREIEESEVDVDDLAERVRTAAELIRICKEKLERTRMEVEKVVAELVPREKENRGGGETSFPRESAGPPRETAAPPGEKTGEESRPEGAGEEGEEETPF